MNKIILSQKFVIQWQKYTYMLTCTNTLQSKKNDPEQDGTDLIEEQTVANL